MHGQIVNTPDSSEIQKTQTVQKLFHRILGTILMFGGCLLVCHAPGLIHGTLGHFSP
ncbi:MAG: hypothetical protein MUD14_00495 [Hydrococcus sp. Prado102]|jgi:hypothetical protein|nr:hypothetical protein [Hydrococcus sp. Prado102]